MNPSDEKIRQALASEKRITVIGLSPEPSRASHGVSRYMMRAGYEITGVRPGAAGEILGRPCFPDLKSVPGPLGIIDVFRKSEAVPGIVDEVLAELARRPATEAPRVLWLQEGVTDEKAEARARAAGLLVISDSCILKEHARLL